MRNPFPEAVLLCTLFYSAGHALTLAEAEQMAVENDPRVLALGHRESAAAERAGAAETLPNPVFRVGAVAFPTDTFDRGQEPMTQLQFAVRQEFPRGNSLALRGDRLRRQGDVFARRAGATSLDVRLEVRRAWIEGVLHRRTLDLLERSRDATRALEELAASDYATGSARQQDIHQAALEVARLDARILRAREDAAAAAARLGTWIAPDVANAIDTRAWPDLSAPVAARVSEHPRVAVADGQVAVAEVDVALAEAQYKPAFGVELAYGHRTGQGPDGGARPDLVSGNLTVDIPIFRSRREDRQLAAAQLDAEASRQERIDTVRRLMGETAEARVRLARINERLTLFEKRLLPEAKTNREVALDAFTASIGSMSDLIETQVLEIELQLEAEQVYAERALANAWLRWLGGQ